MFQTEIILFIQSLASDSLTVIMRTISFVGDGDVMIPLLLAGMLAIHFRGGFFLMHAWIWAGALNGLLKTTTHLPRPVEVDSRVQHLDSGIRNTSDYFARGAASFFSPLPREVLSASGIMPSQGFGFPSGHTACTTACAWILYREKRALPWRLLLFFWIFMTAFSRMYLGRHFLADILGGLAVGFLIGDTLWRMFGRSVSLRWWLDCALLRYRSGKGFPLLMIYLLGGPLVMFLIPQVFNSAAARLLGFNLGFLFLWIKGLPGESGKISHRALRCILGMAIYFLLFWGLKILLLTVGFPSGHWFHLIRHFLAPFLTLAVSIPMGAKIGVWQR